MCLGRHSAPYGGEVGLRVFTVLVAGACLGSGSAAGAAPTAREGSTEALAKLIACRNVADMVQRVTCYDRETDLLEQAAKRRDIVVVDRADVQQTRKTLFGLTLPRLSLLDGDDQNELKEVAGKLASISTDREGRVLLRLADGAQWRQTDELVLGRFPKPGADVVIRRGALGSFRISVGGQPAFKARREN
jgi:hypothetical protein